MCANRSKNPIVHLVGSIPLPDAETVFRTVSGAVGQHLVRLPDGETGIRKTWIKFLQDVLAENPAIEVAKDVPPFKFIQWDGKLIREIPAPAPQAGRQARSRRLQDRLCRHGHPIVGHLRSPAEGGRHPGQHQVPDQPADADRADLQQHGASRPRSACCRR